MHALAAVALLSLVPHGIPEDRVDLLERNAFYDEAGKLVFVQWIGWLWNDTECRYDVAWWRFVVSGRPPPVRVGGEWLMIWRERDGELVRVRAASFLESWTFYDREVINRSLLPTHERRGMVVK